MEDLKKKISMARGIKKADIVFKNAKVIDVFSGKIISGDIAISDKVILGVGSYSGESEIDLEGKFVSPTLIDAHTHIESSMVSPLELSKILILNGVSTIIADPHEIANVLGLDGIRYIISQSKDIPIDVFIMLPSCVPATEFEDSGAKLSFEEIKKLKDEQRVLGLGEMMNYVGVLNCDEVVMEKIEGFQDKIIDGHAPSVEKEDLNAYILSNIKTDHECSEIHEMQERISKGMYVQIRQGTSAKNAEILTKGITKNNLSRILFCTDDKNPKDLIEKGSINENIKIAIKNGLDPIDAIKIASINAANCYGLKNKGAIAPGYEANFIVLDSLEDFEINSVYINGEKYTEKNRFLFNLKEEPDIEGVGKVKVYDYKISDLEIKLKNNKVNVIGIRPNDLITEKLVEEVKVRDGLFVADETYQKLVVAERHKGLNRLSKAVIKGFGIKNGAVASTIAHDSHNIIIIGDNDLDIYVALKEIEKINGGIVVCQDGKAVSKLPLKIVGLMSTDTIYKTRDKLEKVIDTIRKDLDVKNENLDPILTLGFMSLPVIPELKLTDRGLFDVLKFDFIDINV